jgi:hypothetical protein
MQELLVDFITSLTATGQPKAGPVSGGSRAPSISPGSAISPNATTPS